MILAFPAAEAAGSHAPGKVQVVIGLERRASDQISVGDSRPVSRGEVSGVMELAFQPCGPWRWTASGRFGGAWFDFDGPAVSGNIQDWGWAARAGADRIIPLGQPARIRACIGAGFDYGEARSKLVNLVLRDEGPRQFRTGGSVRFGVDIPLARRLDVTVELMQGIYNAHARDWSVGKEYNWIGTSFAGGVGLRWHAFHSCER